jgi:hypothetical protein
MKNELRNLISGKGKVRYGSLIQAAASYLKTSPRASAVAENEKLYRQKETESLKEFITQNGLWVSTINIDNYVSEGAEQKVYLADDKHVLKLNDAIYYVSWRDYFHNLLLHNYFFPDTAYQLKGFAEIENILYAVVEQDFVRATSPTDLQAVKTFMNSNGFAKTKNNDYYNSELGIILEDLHDENVLTENDTLRFIDTVFYLTDNFYKD